MNLYLRIVDRLCSIHGATNTICNDDLSISVRRKGTGERSGAVRVAAWRMRRPDIPPYCRNSY